MRRLRLSEIAKLVEGELLGTEDPYITGAAGLEDAGPGELTFLARKKLITKLDKCLASGIIVGENVSTDIPAIVVKEPYKAFARYLEGLTPDLDRVFPPGIHETAVIDPTADVCNARSIGPFCVVGAGTVIKAGTRIAAHVVVGPDVVIGENCLVYSNVTIREQCILGNSVTVNSSSVIGTDGFGFLPGDNGMIKIPQVGIVDIEDDVEIGACCTIDRATTGKTSIGKGTKIDNMVQIAHNVRIGEHCTLSAQSGVAGSAVLGNGVVAGGRVAVSDHLTVGDGAKLAGGACLIKDVEAGKVVFGYPAMDFKESFRILGAMRRLPDLVRRVTRLENTVADSDKAGEQ